MDESSKLVDTLFHFDVGHTPEIIYQVDYAWVERMIYWHIEEEAKENFLLQLVILLDYYIYHIYWNFPKGDGKVKRSSLVYFLLC